MHFTNAAWTIRSCRWLNGCLQAQYRFTLIILQPIPDKRKGDKTSAPDERLSKIEGF
jgi:hypothetical protein